MWLNVQFPEFGGRGVLAMKDDSVVVTDGDGGLGKGHITASITQLPNQKKWLGGKVWDNVAMAGSSRKTRDVKFGLMGGVKDCSRWGVDGDGSISGPFVADGGVGRKEMCRTPRIGNGVEW